MIHLLFNDRPWFRAKRYGYGAGLPIAWQGWFMLALHVGLILGLALLLRDHLLVLAVTVAAAALLPMPLYAARTEGGWQWRWGNDGDRK